MLLLAAHLVRLLIQLLDDDLFWADVPLQLFYLVIEHELELLQLLNLLLELADLDLFFLNGC